MVSCFRYLLILNMQIVSSFIVIDSADANQLFWRNINSFQSFVKVLFFFLKSSFVFALLYEYATVRPIGSVRKHEIRGKPKQVM